jgi:hypothetical protein
VNAAVRVQESRKRKELWKQLNADKFLIKASIITGRFFIGNKNFVKANSHYLFPIPL